MPISVILPTYKSPDALDLVLTSLIKGQTEENQIIVVVDGFYDLNKKILEKHAKSIDILTLDQNSGTPRATNLGVYNAKYDRILIINDDNVAPNEWDKKLNNIYEPNSVVSPNQVEPYASIFNQFHIKDLGRDPKIFDLDKFWEYENNLTPVKDKDETGSTMPIFMSKIDYMRVGAWDETYPAGWVVDCDFFLKCRLSGMKMIRAYNCHFYHFVSLSVKTEEQKSKAQEMENKCHQYFAYKWGNYMRRDISNNIYF